MGRLVVRVGRNRRDFCIETGRGQPLLCQSDVVIAVNDVVSDTRVMRLLLKDRLKDFSAFPLVGESLIGLGSCDIER